MSKSVSQPAAVVDRPTLGAPLHNALATAAQYGWRVFPVKEKDPCYGCMWKQEATAKAKDIKALFSNHSDADGYGIVLEKGVAVFDHDPHGTKTIKGKAVARGSQQADTFFQEYLAPTLEGRLTATTPGGGLHIFVSDPDGLVPNSNGLFGLRGIDTRSKGLGYVVGANAVDRVWGAGEVRPLSKRLTGHLRKKIADLEERIEQSKATGKPASEEDVVALLQYVSPDAPRMKWLETIWAVADNFKHDQKLAHRILLKWSEGGDTGAVPQGFNKHPKRGYVEGHTDEDIWKQIDSDARRAGTKIHIATLYREALKGGYGRRSMKEALDADFKEKTSIELLNELPDKVQKKRKASSSGDEEDDDWVDWLHLHKTTRQRHPLKSAYALRNKRPPRPIWLYDGLIAKGMAHMVAGQVHSGKTSVTLHMAYTILKNPDERILYLSLDDYRTPFWRLDAIAAHERQRGQEDQYNDRMKRLFFQELKDELPLDDKFSRRQLDEWITDLGITTVIFDTKMNLFPKDNEDTEGAKGTNQILRAFHKHFKCTYLLLHHIGKDLSRGPRGASDYTAPVEMVLVVTTDDDKFEVTPTKNRAAGEQLTYSMVKNPITVITEDGEIVADFFLGKAIKGNENRLRAEANKRKTQKASTFEGWKNSLRSHNGESLLRKEIALVLGLPDETDADQKTVRRIISILCDADQLVKEDNANTKLVKYLVQIADKKEADNDQVSD